MFQYASPTRTQIQRWMFGLQIHSSDSCFLSRFARGRRSLSFCRRRLDKNPVLFHGGGWIALTEFRIAGQAQNVAVCQPEFHVGNVILVGVHQAFGTEIQKVSASRASQLGSLSDCSKVEIMNARTQVVVGTEGVRNDLCAVGPAAAVEHQKYGMDPCEAPGFERSPGVGFL